jgi:NAD(P)H-hydrate repair Nnr-like enzyme with NAD(P)H-hydrate dehydratase domain
MAYLYLFMVVWVVLDVVNGGTRYMKSHNCDYGVMRVAGGWGSAVVRTLAAGSTPAGLVSYVRVAQCQVHSPVSPAAFAIKLEASTARPFTATVTQNL